MHCSSALNNPFPMDVGPVLTCSPEVHGEAPKIWRRESWRLFQLKIPSCSYQILAEKADVYKAQWMCIAFKTNTYPLLWDCLLPSSKAVLHLKSVNHSQTAFSALPLHALNTWTGTLVDGLHLLALFSACWELDSSSFTAGNLHVILHSTLIHLIPHPGNMAKIHAWCIYPCRLPACFSDVYTYVMSTGVTQSHQNELAQAPEQSLVQSYTNSYGEKSLTVNRRMIFRFSLPSCPQGIPLCGCYSFSLIWPFTLCRCCCCWVGKTQLVQSKPLGAGSWLSAPSASALPQFLLQGAKQILKTLLIAFKDYPDCRGDVTAGKGYGCRQKWGKRGGTFVRIWQDTLILHNGLRWGSP